MKSIMTIRKLHALRYCRLLIFLLAIVFGGNCFATDLEKDLNEAIVNNRDDNVAMILNNGGSQLRTAIKSRADYYIMHSSRYGTAAIVRQIIDSCGLDGEKQSLNAALVESIANRSFAEVVPLLLAYGANPNYEHHVNYALNRVVMQYGGIQNKSAQLMTTVQTLLDSGAYIDSFDDAGETPLMIACRKEDLPLVRLLLAKGANPSLTNKDMKSAMSYAKAGSAMAAALKAAAEKRERSILNFGKTPAGAPDDDQTISSKNEPVRVSPQSPGQTIFGTPTNEFDSYTQSIGFDNYMADLMQLSAAVSSGDAETVKELLGKGLKADSVVDDSGITLLMQAANDDIAKILLDAGAEATKADAKGWTALHHLATREADGKMATRLINAGADIHYRNNDGETPLRLAGLLFTENIAAGWGKSLISLLVNAGADIDSTDKQGHTLLHQAAFNDNEALARTCVLKGGNPDLKTKAGNTPRQTAVTLRAKGCLKVFARK